jgi:sugar (pentulose or hexulose) kinase
VTKLVKRGLEERGAVSFEPYLAGDRASVEQRAASFHGLTLSTTREDMLSAILGALARASAARIDLLRSVGTPVRRDVMTSGGGGKALSKVMYRDWPGRWEFRAEREATMRGLSQLV